MFSLICANWKNRPQATRSCYELHLCHKNVSNHEKIMDRFPNMIVLFALDLTTIMDDLIKNDVKCFVTTKKSSFIVTAVYRPVKSSETFSFLTILTLNINHAQRHVIYMCMWILQVLFFSCAQCKKYKTIKSKWCDQFWSQLSLLTLVKVTGDNSTQTHRVLTLGTEAFCIRTQVVPTTFMFLSIKVTPPPPVIRATVPQTVTHTHTHQEHFQGLQPGPRRRRGSNPWPDSDSSMIKLIQIPSRILQQETDCS